MSAAGSTSQHPLSTEPSSRPNILVVDDDPRVGRALAGILKEEGFDPVVFHSGAAALAHAQHNPPAAALLDVHLPDLNGLVLSQKLRQRLGPERPIIILSGDTSMEVLTSLARAGATYFFSKPVHLAHLLGQLKAWVA